MTKITPPAVSAAVTAIQTAITNVGVLQGASDTALSPVVNAVISAQSIIAAEIATFDQLIGPGVGMGAGTPPVQAITWLNGQITATATDANLIAIESYVAGVGMNIAQRL